MTSVQFCYWLQGFFELRKAGLAQPCSFSMDQTECIERHLSLVFKHEIDASQGSAEHQAELQAIHDGKQAIAPLANNPWDRVDSNGNRPRC